MLKYMLVPVLAALLPLLLPSGRNFEYEYTTLNAYACLLLIPFGALIAPNAPDLWRRLWAMLIGLLGNVLPAFLAFRLRLCPCAEGEFFTFWLLQTLPHLLLGFGIANWVDSALGKGRSRLPLLLAGGSAFFVSCSYLLSLVWLEPQKRATHIFAGFLHGAIYDDWIPLDSGILFARGAHACLGLALLCFTLLTATRWRWGVTGFFVLAWAGLALKARQSPSQSHGLAILRQHMPEQKLGPGFVLHYQNRIDDKDFQQRLDTIYQSTLFHSTDLMRLLQVPDPAVQVFVYPNRESKKLWFGGDGTDITDVVTPSIHITLEDWPHSTLRHELVHAIASRFAYHGLGFHPNMAFTEGLAIALAPSDDEMSLHEGAADIIKNRRIAQIENLFSPLFWSESGRRAYTVAGSLILYLLDQGGLAKVKALYAGANWEETFGQSSSSIIGDWQSFLREHHAVLGAALQAESIFRYPGILHDICPHSKALLAKNASGFLISLRQPKNWQASRDYWPWRESLDQSPTARLMLLQQRFKSLANGTPDPKFDDDLHAVLVQPPKILEHIEAFILRTDRLIQQQDRGRAKQNLQNFIPTVTELRIGDDLLRQLWVRWLLLRDAPQDQQDLWLKLLAGLERSLPKQLRPSPSWIETYLYVRNGPSAQISAQLLSQLAVQPVPAELPHTFHLEWWKILGQGFSQKGDLDTAIAMYARAAELAPEGSRASLHLLVEELKFRKKPQAQGH